MYAEKANYRKIIECFLRRKAYNGYVMLAGWAPTPGVLRIFVYGKICEIVHAEVSVHDARRLKTTSLRRTKYKKIGRPSPKHGKAPLLAHWAHHHGAVVRKSGGFLSHRNFPPRAPPSTILSTADSLTHRLSPSGSSLTLKKISAPGRRRQNFGSICWREPEAAAGDGDSDGGGDDA